MGRRTRGTRAGKSGYLAPERIRGEGATSSSDLFAAGVISVELLLGRKLFEGDGPEEILDRIRRFDARTLPLPGVSPELAGVLRKSVAALPADRYPGAAGFLVELARVAPPPASAPVMADFWDALFPVPQEEETAPDPAAEPESLPAMVKEPGERYGRGGEERFRRALPPCSRRSSSEASSCGRRCGNDRRSMRRRLRWPRRPPSFRSLPSLRPCPPAPPVVLPRFRRRENRSAPKLPPRVTPRNPDPPATPGKPVARLVRVETDPPGASVLLESGASIGKTPLQMDVASSRAGRSSFRRTGTNANPSRRMRWRRDRHSAPNCSP